MRQKEPRDALDAEKSDAPRVSLMKDRPAACALSVAARRSRDQLRTAPHEGRSYGQRARSAAASRYWSCYSAIGDWSGSAPVRREKGGGGRQTFNLFNNVAEESAEVRGPVTVGGRVFKLCRGQYTSGLTEGAAEAPDGLVRGIIVDDDVCAGGRAGRSEVYG